uniref:Uncharacterized protein n=1 Tax=Caenorhabditis japonica TaxID=281687 RepID=A0A8R1HMS3_CAEJA
MLSRYIELLPNRQNTRKLLSKADSKSPKRRLAYRKLLPKSVIAGACFTAEGEQGHDSFYPTVESLKLALLNTWDDIDDNYLRRTVDSVPDRLKACIEAKGFNFEHVLK